MLTEGITKGRPAGSELWLKFWLFIINGAFRWKTLLIFPRVAVSSGCVLPLLSYHSTVHHLPKPWWSDFGFALRHGFCCSRRKQDPSLFPYPFHFLVVWFFVLVFGFLIWLEGWSWFSTHKMRVMVESFAEMVHFMSNAPRSQKPRPGCFFPYPSSAQQQEFLSGMEITSRWRTTWRMPQLELKKTHTTSCDVFTLGILKFFFQSLMCFLSGDTDALL